MAWSPGEASNLKIPCQLVFCMGDTVGVFCHTAPVTHHTAPIVGTLLVVMGSTHGFTLKTMVLRPRY